LISALFFLPLYRKKVSNALPHYILPYFVNIKSIHYRHFNMKKLFASLLAAIAISLLGSPSAMAAFQQIYICGAINGQGWHPGAESAIELNNPENGWFRLTVTQEGEFKVSSSVSSDNSDWTGFDKGVAKFLLANAGINTITDKESTVNSNSTIPAGTKIVYFSSDLRKAAASDGNWVPSPYTEPTTPDIPSGSAIVKVDVSKANWTTVNCYYWGGSSTAPEWPGIAMTKESDNIWAFAFDDSSRLPSSIIFNNSSEQTIDLTFESGKTYVLDSKDPAQENKWTIVSGGQSTTGLSNTLPVLYINIYKTNADGSFALDGNGDKILDNYQLQVEEIDKDYRPGEYWLDMNGCTTVPGENIGSADEPLPLEMKGRGNWTRKGFAKKPFKLKLGKKQQLLGMGTDKSKHWAILAHADDDYGYLRNFCGFNLGKRIGLPWTPSQQPVEVVINGNYRGLYFLTESIRVGDGRVPIEELNDNETDQNLISGGYLVELDNYDEENQIRMSEKSCADGQTLDELRITFDTPEAYSDIQKRFITEQFETMNDYVGKANTPESNGLWAYLDLDDAARYYIVMEILSHTESYHGSTYLFRNRGEGQKWHFSPIWDMGNAFNGSTSDFLFNCDPYGNTWIPSIYLNARFRDKVRETWKWFMTACYTDFMEDIDTYCNTIAAAAKADHTRWANVAPPANGQPVQDNSDMNSRKNAAKQKINQKIDWLRSEWGNYGTQPLAEPERDNTEAALLPDYATTGIEDITSPDASDSPATYFNLQGIRVADPTPGAIYIRRQGNTSSKVAL